MFCKIMFLTENTVTFSVILSTCTRAVSWENIAELEAFPKRGSNEENYIGTYVWNIENTLELPDY